MVARERDSERERERERERETGKKDYERHERLQRRLNMKTFVSLVSVTAGSTMCMTVLVLILIEMPMYT